MRPIVKQIDIVIPGNHDNHIFNETTDEVVFDICKYLGIPEKYHFGDYSGTLRFGKCGGKKNKQISYKFYVAHGTGGATTLAGKIKKLNDLALVVRNADFYMQAHFHDILTFKKEPFWIDSRNHQQKTIKQTFVSSSSWLDYGGYALEKKYEPAKTGSPRVRLYGYRKDIHVSI